MVVKKRLAYQNRADLFVLIGVPAGAGWSYEMEVGLILNIERMRSQVAYLTASGTSIGNSSEPVEPEIFASVTTTEAEAEEMTFKANADRMWARVKARRGL